MGDTGNDVEALLLKLSTDLSAEILRAGHHGSSTSSSNCTELKVVYPNGVAKGHLAYQAKMDRDNDSWACE